MPPEDEKTGSFFQRNRLWLIIGGALIILIIVFSVRGQSSPSSAEPKITLQSLDSSMTLLGSTVGLHGTSLEMLEGKIAIQAETISDMCSDIDDIPDWNSQIDSLKSRLTDEESKSTTQASGITTILTKIDSLQEQINAFNGTAEQINLINTTLEELQAEFDNLPAYVEVTGVSGINVNAKVHGKGDFTIVVTLYGSGMETASLFNFYNDAYTISGSYVGSNSTLAVILEPVTTWDNDEIKFAVSDAIVDYASASIGGS